MISIAAYLGAIIAANLSVARLGPAAAPFIAFLFIGFDLTLRDRLHEAWRGARLWPKMLALIAAGSLLSWLLNRGAGQVALASFIAFLLAGIADAASYHVLRRQPWLAKANGSNLVSAAVDSLIFPTLAFGAWLPLIVAAQFVAKVAGGALWSVVLAARGRRGTENDFPLRRTF